MLIILGGLPGVGKTTIAKALAKQLQAMILRVDTVEQVLKREEGLDGPEGYMVCWAQALENLRRMCSTSLTGLTCALSGPRSKVGISSELAIAYLTTLTQSLARLSLSGLEIGQKQ